MKILYIDQHMTGHHIPFLKNLLNGVKNHQIVLMTDKSNISELGNLVEKIYGIEDKKGFHYGHFCMTFLKVIKNEKPDIVHFLCGDDYFRNLLLGVGAFCKSKNVMMTIHKYHPGNGFLKKVAWRLIYKRFAWINKVIVVQTDCIKDSLHNIGIRNVRVIDYPSCYSSESIKTDKNILSLKKPECPILLALGATRFDKGLDILLSAIKRIDKTYLLIIAGKEDYFDRAFIEKETKELGDKVCIDLKFLSDDELISYIKVSDYIVIPYRKCFDGQSGPLNEGVWQNKIIIGPNHGSLGEVIMSNHLGYVFDSENVVSLANTISKAMDEPFSFDKYYMNYQRKISSNEFQRKYNRTYLDVNSSKK